ncbi:hypothetical protein VTP01DRAFT_10767 [Rhizomucor pusillus]|uniref:uncharacterized protein n=1 Tax=Rhizomucor pusillus TaxID=4840 RepID=UPI003742FA9F
MEPLGISDINSPTIGNEEVASAPCSQPMERNLSDSIGSPSSQSVRSLTLSPDENKATRKKDNNSNNSAVLIGHQLTSNTIFYDIPVNDVFSELMERYIPPEHRPQREGWNENTDKPDALPNLIMSNMWRSVARYARHQITQSSASQLESILRLWYLRLLALMQLGLYQLASAELEKLGNLYRPELTFEYHGISGKTGSIVPFELLVLSARLPFYLKYPLISLERLTLLAVHCKKMYKKTESQLWKQRETQVYIILATQQMHMNDYTAAATTLQMVSRKVAGNDLDILSILGRLYLQLGNVQGAEELFQRIEKDSKGTSIASFEEAVQMHRGFVFMARGEWNQARQIFEQVLANNKENLVAANDLAVCLTYLGQVDAAVEKLAEMIENNPTSAGTCETALFNLCTLYDLRQESGAEKKVQLMGKIARWVGDSFKAECIKLS